MTFRKPNDFNVNEEQGNQQSRINAAGLINSALERLWMDCYNAMSNGNLVLWNRKLDAIWNILGGDCKKGEKEDKEILRLNMNLYKTGSLNHKKIGFEKLKEDESEIMAQQYLWLNEKSLYLRRLQNQQGKGTAYTSDDEDDFD